MGALALVEEGVLVAAVTEALCERCNSQHTQGGRKFATASFKNIPADLLVAFCQSRPELWHLVKDTTDRKGKRVEQRELRARAARLRAEQRQQRMELESARSDSDTEERDMPSPCSAESFTSIDSWDAAHFPAVRQHYRQKMARRAAEAARLVEQEAAEPEAAAGTAGPSTRPRRYNVVYGRSQKGKAAH
eukprot:jgi/Tetstr1/421798/TSEL_012701.t1